MNNSEFTIIAFYQFKKINDLEKYKNLLKNFCSFHKIKGTILLAKEGINGTVAGFFQPIEFLEKQLKDMGFKNLTLKYSYYKFMPFYRFKIKIKKEIVTFNDLKSNVASNTAKKIDSKKWNNLIKDKKIILVDVRNDFECLIGSFEGAINPKTKSFTDFKKYIDNNLLEHKNKKIAMFCTGGIRCEKASSYMIRKGFKNLFQLKGGILEYLKNIPKIKSRWEGECFVFDNRVSVQNELLDGTYVLCHGCRNPISSKDKLTKKYKKGISCPKCYNLISKEKKAKLIERNKQIKISKKKGLYNPYIKVTTTNY